MLEYASDTLLDPLFTERCVTQVPDNYKAGDRVLLRDSRSDDPKRYKIFKVLGHGEYKLSRNGKSDGKVYREKDLLEDPTYAGGRQSRKILPPARTAKRKSPRVYRLPPSPPESGSQALLEDPTGHEGGSLSVQGSDGTTQKDVKRFEPGLSGLSDCSTVNGDDDKLPETLSREDLSKFEPSTYSMRIGVHEASLDVINVGEERRKAREERVEAVELQGTDPKSYKIYGALGDNRYKLSKKRSPNGKVYRAEDFLDNKPLQAIGGLWKASGANPKAIDEQAKAIEEHVKGREERAKAVEVDMKSHKRGDVHGSLAKPLKLEREEIEPNVFDGEISGGSLKMPFIKTETENGLQDLARDTRIATGPGTKHDWIDSLLSKPSVRGVFSHPLRQSPPKGTRRWSFKSPFSVFGLGECSLEREKTRVRWRCVCGRQMYDDFIELRPGAAADLEKWLNDSIRNHAVNRASNSSQDSTWRSSNASSEGVSGQRQTAGSDISLQPLSWTASRLPDSDKNAAVAIDVHLEKCWLLICGQPRKGPDSLLAQLDLSSKPSDRELFDGMRKFHSSLRDAFTLLPVLKGVQTIRFVQVNSEKSPL